MTAIRHFSTALAVLPLVLAAAPAEYILYVGTYTRGESKGIYAWRFQAAKGEFTSIGLVAETPNPSFLAIHPNRKYLYAVSERQGGAVSAFSIDAKTARLSPLNTVSSRGGGPCYVSIDKAGKTVFAANYGSGSVAALPIQDDGRLGEASGFAQHAGSGADPKRQQGPHAHWIQASADNRFAVATDLGLDQVLIYRFDAAKGTLAPHDPPFAKVNNGAGPRHFAFHPSDRFAYVINELQNTVTVFAWDAKRGALKDLQTITTLPAGYATETYTAEVAVHPSGRFLYGSNRGHDSIAVFSIDPRQGTLASVEITPTQGKFPRNFVIDPTGAYVLVANMNSNHIVVFRIDPKTGRLTATGQVLAAYAPVCLRFMAAE